MKKFMKKISVVCAIVINSIYTKVFASIDPGQVIGPTRTQIAVAEESGWWYVMKKLYIIPILFVIISIIYFKKNSSSVLKKVIIITIVALLLFGICCWLDNILIKEMTVYMY